MSSSVARERTTIERSVVCRVFEEATLQSMGSAFHTILCFHLTKKFGKDPYDVLLQNPRQFYGGLVDVLGAGADAVLSLVATFLRQRYEANCSSEEFVGLFTKGDDWAKRRLQELLSKAGGRGK